MAVGFSTKGSATHGIALHGNAAHSKPPQRKETKSNAAWVPRNPSQVAYPSTIPAPYWPGSY
jgi:hypothetical protein